MHTPLTPFIRSSFDKLIQEATAPIYAARAAAINQARAEGRTWRSIAAELDMAEISVQRAPGVNSPWNERHHTPETPNTPTPPDTAP